MYMETTVITEQSTSIPEILNPVVVVMDNTTESCKGLHIIVVILIIKPFPNQEYVGDYVRCPGNSHLS